MGDNTSQIRLSPVQRRRFLKSVGATSGVLAMAGCFGEDDDLVDNGDDANGDDGDDGTQEEVVGDDEDVDTDDIDPDEWPDLEGQEVHILTQESSEPYQEYWQWLAARFNQATGAYVRMEYTGFGVGLQERIAQLIQGGDPPELSHLGHPGVATYGHLGLLADHTEAVEYWEDRWGEIPEGSRYLQDGVDQFLPILTNVHTLWYRDDVFDEVPDTWEKHLAMAEENDEGEGGIRGTALMMSPEENTPQIGIYSAGWSNGVQFFDREGGDGEVIPVFHDDYLDETVETLEYYRELYQYSDDLLDLSGGDYIQLVGNERAYANAWVGSRPKFYGEDQEFGGDIRPCPFPTREEGNLTPWGHNQGYTAFEESDTEAAMEFLKFWAEPENLIGGPHAGFYFADPIHNAPVIEEIRDHELYQEQLDQLPDYWNVPEDLNFDWIEYGTELPAETEPPNEHVGLIYDSLEMTELLRDVCVREEDPEEACQNRAENIRQIIESA